MKFHSLELGEDLLSALAPVNGAGKLADYKKSKVKYEEQGKDIRKEAEEKEHETKAAEDRALRYDIGEGLLEIALVLSSLYFIAHKKLFPVVGIVAGIAGIAIAISGYADVNVMPELEIHHEIEGGHDPLGQRVGVLAAVLAVFLAVVTHPLPPHSHRCHPAQSRG